MTLEELINKIIEKKLPKRVYVNGHEFAVFWRAKGYGVLSRSFNPLAGQSLWFGKTEIVVGEIEEGEVSTRKDGKG